MAIFKEVVENRIDDPRGRLIRLIKYTKGEAKELVMNYIHQPFIEGYQIAKMLLEKRHGDPHRLLGSYRKEIKEWQQLKLRDAAGFRKFSNFLVRCKNVTGRDNWNLLDNPDIICLLLSKLPGVLLDRWNRRVFNIRMNNTMEPSLLDLVLFIDEETTLVNDPLFSRDAFSQYQEKKETYDRKKKVNTFLVKTEIQTNESFKLKAQKEEIECPVCGKSHGIENCEDFLKLGIEERSKMIFNNKCYGC